MFEDIDHYVLKLGAVLFVFVLERLAFDSHLLSLRRASVPCRSTTQTAVLSAQHPCGLVLAIPTRRATRALDNGQLSDNTSAMRDRIRPESAPLRVTPEPIKKTVVRVEIINRLLKMVRSNELKPGARLPSEPALATMLGVSRPSLREALTVLETLGVVEVRRGVGAFVKDPSAAALDSPGLPRPSAAVEELEFLAPVLHKVRLAVEPVAASLAAERATPEELDRLKAELERLTAAARTRDIIEAAAADVAFHNVILEASHSPLLASIVGALEKPLRQTRETTLGSYWNEVWVVRTHSKIFTTIRQHRPKAAQQAMTRHLQAVEKMIRTIDWTARKARQSRKPGRALRKHRR